MTNDRWSVRRRIYALHRISLSEAKSNLNDGLRWAVLYIYVCNLCLQSMVWLKLYVVWSMNIPSISQYAIRSTLCTMHVQYQYSKSVKYILVCCCLYYIFIPEYDIAISYLHEYEHLRIRLYPFLADKLDINFEGSPLLDGHKMRTILTIPCSMTQQWKWVGGRKKEGGSCHSERTNTPACQAKERGEIMVEKEEDVGETGKDHPSRTRSTPVPGRCQAKWTCCTRWKDWSQLRLSKLDMFDQRDLTMECVFSIWIDFDNPQRIILILISRW